MISWHAAAEKAFQYTAESAWAVPCQGAYNHMDSLKHIRCPGLHEIEEKADELALDILRLAIQPDHVHLFITGNPKLAPNKIIQQLKGYTSRNLRDEFDFGLPSLWTRSYFVSSAGEVSSQTIEEYIQAQIGR